MPRTITNQDTGLKILHEPADDAHVEVDVIAIHGIGAHPDDTWSKRVDTSNSSFVNWLSDSNMLPSALPNARIMRFGYKSAWYGNAVIQQNVTRVATSFLHSLRRMRKNPRCQNRPLLLVAHCFGGLVVLQALLEAEQFPEKWPNIYHNVAGVAFFGTPFRGAEQQGQMALIQAAQIMHEGSVHPEVLRITRPGDELLLQLVDRFEVIRRRSSSQMKLMCFFETEPTNLLAIVGQNGPRTMRVDESSGCLDGAGRLGLQRTHFNMNKFSDPYEDEYLNIVDILTDMARVKTGPISEHPRQDVSSSPQRDSMNLLQKIKNRKARRKKKRSQGGSVVTVVGPTITGTRGYVDARSSAVGRDKVQHIITTYQAGSSNEKNGIHQVSSDDDEKGS